MSSTSTGSPTAPSAGTGSERPRLRMSKKATVRFTHKSAKSISAPTPGTTSDRGPLPESRANSRKSSRVATKSSSDTRKLPHPAAQGRFGADVHLGASQADLHLIHVSSCVRGGLFGGEPSRGVHRRAGSRLTTTRDEVDACYSSGNGAAPRSAARKAERDACSTCLSAASSFSIMSRSSSTSLPRATSSSQLSHTVQNPGNVRPSS
jgi:hypothetical protein